MADELHAGICSTPMSYWNTNMMMMRNPNSYDWTQPFLPMEFNNNNQIQASYGDHSSPLNLQLRDMNDQGFLPGLFEPDPLRDMMNNNNEPAAAALQTSWSNTCNSPSPAPHHQFNNSRVSVLPSKQQLNFSNDAPFWSPSTNSVAEPRFEDESSCSNLITKKPSATKKNGTEPATKKRRIETPSPLPTFKVRKEKLGDRITALQQLVSPFGKTDTASVLHEAIDYIKFLHGQVNALSTPYLKNGHQIHQQQHQMQVNSEDNQDLRSRGLCLVPISSTFAVASETPMDFWAPTLLGNYI